MTPQAQRIAIAEACGLSEMGYMAETLMHAGTGAFVEVPDYLNDLNAMHEAENVLDGYMMLKYVSELLALTGGAGTGGSFSHVHATAAQRAEAFLRTLNKWDDSK